MAGIEDDTTRNSRRRDRPRPAMTPHVASHAHSAESIQLPLARSELIATGIGRLLDGRVWAQARLLLDAIVLCLATTAAFYAAPLPRSGGAGWLAAVFPVLTLVILRARHDPDERLDPSTLDTAVHVLGAASLSAMLMVAAGSIMGGSSSGRARVASVAVRRRLPQRGPSVLASVRSQARRNQALATPTLIVGAGVGRRAPGQAPDRAIARYGLRPVGFLDSDPMPTSGYAPLPPSRSWAGRTTWPRRSGRRVRAA